MLAAADQVGTLYIIYSHQRNILRVPLHRQLYDSRGSSAHARVDSQRSGWEQMNAQQEIAVGRKNKGKNKNASSTDAKHILINLPDTSTDV